MTLQKLCLLALSVTLILGTTALAGNDKSVEDKDLGLDKNSVFDTPDPIQAPVLGGEPGENATLQPYFDGAPPMIPHQIVDFVPITIDENQCADCHVDAELVGTTVEEGEATPAPASHFTDLRRAADKVTAELIGARFLCTQCHATQADAKPLVENTFE